MPHVVALRQLFLSISSNTYIIRKDNPLRFLCVFSLSLEYATQRGEFGTFEVHHSFLALNPCIQRLKIIMVF